MALDHLPEKNGFRLRGLEMTRLETFIDAAFAFAITTLVISVGDIPSNFDELISALKKVPAFLASFLAMMAIWLGHRKWSRRYGLENTTTIIVSLLLIFVLLIYIFPLRLIFSSFLNFITVGFLPSEFDVKSLPELQGLFIFYGLGLMAIAGIMSLLYKLAENHRSELGLNELELLKTKSEKVVWLTQSLTGLVSALFAWLMPSQIAVFAGFWYMSFPISLTLVASYFKRKLKEL